MINFDAIFCRTPSGGVKSLEAELHLDNKVLKAKVYEYGVYIPVHFFSR